MRKEGKEMFYLSVIFSLLNKLSTFKVCLPVSADCALQRVVGFGLPWIQEKVMIICNLAALIQLKLKVEGNRIL